MSSKNICDFLIFFFLYLHEPQQNIYEYAGTNKILGGDFSPIYIWALSFLSIIWEPYANIKEVIFNQSFLSCSKRKKSYSLGQAGLCQGKRCLKLQNHANRVRWGEAKDRTSPSLWVTPGMKPGLRRFHNNDAVGPWTYCSERPFTLLRPCSFWWSECEKINFVKPEGTLLLQ